MVLLSARFRLLPPFIVSLVFSLANTESFLSSREGTKGRIQDVLEHATVRQPVTCSKVWLAYLLPKSNYTEPHAYKLRLTGPIETTLCDYETVESVNEDLYSRLNQLVHTPFFKYFKVCRSASCFAYGAKVTFKVDLYRDCPFWQENGFCMHRECGVTSVDEVCSIMLCIIDEVLHCYSTE